MTNGTAMLPKMRCVMLRTGRRACSRKSASSTLRTFRCWRHDWTEPSFAFKFSLHIQTSLCSDRNNIRERLLTRHPKGHFAVSQALPSSWVRSVKQVFIIYFFLDSQRPVRWRHSSWRCNQRSYSWTGCERAREKGGGWLIKKFLAGSFVE